MPLSDNSPDGDDAKSGPLVSPVVRALRLLRYVVEGGSTSNLSEVGRLIDVNRVTVMRLIATLEHEGVLEALPQGGHRLGIGFLKLATAATAADDLLSLARRVLPQVRQALNLSSYLAALDGVHVVYLLRDMPEAGLVSSIKVGSRLEAYRATPGRVLLAWQPAAALDTLLADPAAGLPPAERKRLRAQLSEDRAQGCAWSFSGLEQGINACAAPVFDGNGQVAAAISVAGPETAFQADPGLQARTTQVVVQAARELSSLLGCRVYPPGGRAPG